MRDSVRWILKETEGTTLSDSIILFLIKLSYLSIRIFLRVILGKEKRDRWYIKRGLDYGTFWFFAVKYLFPNAKNLLRFKCKRYGYEFYCRLNKDDFKVMTIHEEELIESFKPAMGDTFIDVGAHIGLYSIIGSKLVGANGKVIAIEAEPCNYQMLASNIQLNRLENVEALNCAAFSKDDNVKLYLRSAGSNFTKYNTLISIFTQSEDGYIMVKARTLDSLIAETGTSLNVNWMKIDVEGAEFEVLKGADKILSESNDLYLLLELHGGEVYWKPKLENFLKVYKFDTVFQRYYKENGSAHFLLHKT